SDILYSQEISMTATVIFSVISIFPLQEYLITRLKSVLLSEYLSDDPLSARLAHRRFDLDALITNVFPDMVKISGSTAGRLAILNNEESNFDIYTYSRGKQRKVKTKEENVKTRLVQFLKLKKTGVTIADALNFWGINDDFLALKSNYIQPFIFREKLFGFIAVTNIPGKEGIKDMALLSSKSAIAVYNHILSSQVAENRKYKREFESASRIQYMIQNTAIPKMKDFEVRLIEKDPNILMEFFKDSEENFYFVMLSLNPGKKGSGLVLAYMLGTLYIRSLFEKKININNLKTFIIETLKSISWSDPFDLLLGTIEDHDSSQIVMIQEGINFKVVNSRFPDRNMISVGWRNNLNVPETPIYFQIRGKSLLSLSAKVNK
ncbi:MAG: hypothetical protein K8R21_14640, partial [Leptospira sp.]|nr:hypothetical protein [Leptospira sp.]